jgi:LPXTG-motif cell wall-anchored protein
VRIRSLLSMSGLSISVAVLVGALGCSSAAFAADGDPAKLIALTAHDSTLNGTTYEVKPGTTVGVEAGVANIGDEPVSGVVVHLWFIGSEQRLTDGFSNCRYHLNGSEQGAWCEFDQQLSAGGKYALPPLHVSVPAEATAVRTLVEQTYSKAYVDSRGGIAALAKYDGVPAAALVPGTGAEAGLVEGTDLKPAKYPGATSFIYFKLLLPSASPSASVSASPSATSSASPSASTSASSTPAGVDTTAPEAAGGQGGADGGGLPVTGSNITVLAGVGLVLLAGGAAAVLLSRRRRARFTA